MSTSTASRLSKPRSLVKLEFVLTYCASSPKDNLSVLLIQRCLPSFATFESWLHQWHAEVIKPTFSGCTFSKLLRTSRILFEMSSLERLPLDAHLTCFCWIDSATEYREAVSRMGRAERWSERVDCTNAGWTRRLKIRISSWMCRTMNVRSPEEKTGLNQLKEQGTWTFTKCWPSEAKLWGIHSQYLCIINLRYQSSCVAVAFH